MADHHEVVDLGPLADARRLEGAAIDRRAGPDLDIIGNLDPAQLRHLDVPALLESIAKPIGPDHRVGMNGNAVSQHRVVIKDDAGVQGDIVADPAERLMTTSGCESDSGHEVLPSPIIAKEVNAGIGPADLHRGMDDGPRIDAHAALRLGAADWRWRTMATKEVSGSATWMTLLPLASMLGGTTTAEAWLSWS